MYIHLDEIKCIKHKIAYTIFLEDWGRSVTQLVSYHRCFKQLNTLHVSLPDMQNLQTL